MGFYKFGKSRRTVGRANVRRGRDAERAIRAKYEREGWTTKDAATNAYDFTATKGRKIRRVECKSGVKSNTQPSQRRAAKTYGSRYVVHKVYRHKSGRWDLSGVRL